MAAAPEIAATEVAPRRRPSPDQSVWGLLSARVGVVLLVAAVIEAVERLAWVPPTFIARPSEVVVRFVSTLAGGALPTAVRTTLTEVVIALVFALLGGLLIGYTIWRFRVLYEAFMPVISALFSSPVILLYPIPLVLLGRTESAVVAMATVWGCLPVIMYTTRAFAEVPVIYRKIAEVERLSETQRFRLVMFPAAVPLIFTGMRLGITYVLITVVAMEFLVQLGGLGQQIQLAGLRFDVTGVYTYILTVLLLVGAVISTLQAIERRVQR